MYIIEVIYIKFLVVYLIFYGKMTNLWDIAKSFD